MIVAGIGLAISDMVTVHAAEHGLYSLLMARAGVGFFAGLIVPCCQALLAQWAPTSEKGWLTAVMFAGQDIGLFVAPLSAPALLDYGGPELLTRFWAKKDLTLR